VPSLNIPLSVPKTQSVEPYCDSDNTRNCELSVRFEKRNIRKRSLENLGTISPNKRFRTDDSSEKRDDVEILKQELAEAKEKVEQLRNLHEQGKKKESNYEDTNILDFRLASNI